MKFMNGLNRVIIVIGCLILMATLTALFIFPHVILEGVGRWMMDWGNYLGRQDPWVRLGVGVALAAVVNLLLLAVIVLEVRRRRGRYLRVQQVAGGMATISVESVTELLQHRLDPLPGVINVAPEIHAKGNKVDARVEVGVSRGTNIPETASLLIKTVQSVLTDELGMQIAGQPEVQVTVVARDSDRDSVPDRSRIDALETPPPLPLSGTASATFPEHTTSRREDRDIDHRQPEPTAGDDAA